MLRCHYEWNDATCETSIAACIHLAAGTYHEQIRIESGFTGHSYKQVFGQLLDDTVTAVQVDDLYVRSIHQASFCYPR